MQSIERVFDFQMSFPIPGGGWRSNDEAREVAMAANPSAAADVLRVKLSGGPTWEGMQLDMVLSILTQLLTNVLQFKSTRARGSCGCAFFSLAVRRHSLRWLRRTLRCCSKAKTPVRPTPSGAIC